MTRSRREESHPHRGGETFAENNSPQPSGAIRATEGEEAGDVSATCFGHEDSGGWKRGNIRQVCLERLFHSVCQSGVTQVVQETFYTVRWGTNTHTCTRIHTRTGLAANAVMLKI